MLTIRVQIVGFLHSIFVQSGLTGKCAKLLKSGVFDTGKVVFSGIDMPDYHWVLTERDLLLKNTEKHWN